MSCEDLVCASCANPVADGRCPTCRIARAHVHVPPFALGPQLLVALILLLLALTALIAR